MNVQSIARIAYEAIRTYNKIRGQYTTPPWEWASENERNNYINAANALINAPEPIVFVAEEVSEIKIKNSLFRSIVVGLLPYLE